MDPPAIVDIRHNIKQRIGSKGSHGQDVEEEVKPGGEGGGGEEEVGLVIQAQEGRREGTQDVTGEAYIQYILSLFFRFKSYTFGFQKLKWMKYTLQI